MENQQKGFSSEPTDSSLKKGGIAAHEEDLLRNEFEIMQRLDFVFIKELGATSAEEYILKVTELKYAFAKHPDRKRSR